MLPASVQRYVKRLPMRAFGSKPNIECRTARLNAINTLKGCRQRTRSASYSEKHLLVERNPPPGSSPPLSRGEALLSILALSLGLWWIIGAMVSLVL